MKVIQFLIFFSVFFGVYFLVNYYIYVRGLQAFTFAPLLRSVYIKLFIILAMAYITGRILERITICRIADFLTWIGSYWLALMVYFLIIVILIDVIRVVDHFLPFLPAFIRSNPAQTNFILGMTAIGIVLLIVIAGRINAVHPHIREINISISKKVNDGKDITIAMASDIHLGAVVGQKRLRKMIRMMDELKPDLILFAGDVIDEDPGSLIKKDLGECLKELNAPLGVFSITGNHEYIGGVTKAIEYLESHNITMLRDSVVILPNGITIIGREDIDSHRFNGIHRKSISELIKDINPSLPLILLDHQPSSLNDAIDNNIDLQLSGHTHHGQLWPFNYITSKLFRVSFGYEKIQNTHIYVSCGFGSWGPPIRTTARPELVKINLKFDSK
ncbi:MAG: metallophosphoesterase [Candidatus Marinimicrobia bacterium]|nr:metallophosphoesterase [Candidatus Neomarinimicrobiota bacterium]